MIRNLRRHAVAATIAATLALAACGTASVTSTSSDVSNAGTVTTSTTAENAAAVTSTVAAPVGALASIDTHFDDDDLTWDASEEQVVTLADSASASSASGVSVSGDTITITQGGVYRLSGTLSDGQVVVAAPDDQSVTLILDGVTITNSTGPAVAVTTADEVTISLAANTTNALTDGSGYTVADDATPVAALASAADLTIAGTGSLTVTGNTNDAINSSDGLVIAGGTITAQATDDGIRGKDYVSVLDGTVAVTAGGDAITSDNADDADRGWVLISGGAVTLDAGSDGIDAAQAVEVSRGELTVARSAEGLESANVTISGGTVSITASDDGINTTLGTQAGGTEGDDGSLLAISAGTLTVAAGSDGLDANGSVSITGGTITVTSQSGRGSGAVDANGQITFENATLTAGKMRVWPEAVVLGMSNAALQRRSVRPAAVRSAPRLSREKPWCPAKPSSWNSRVTSSSRSAMASVPPSARRSASRTRAPGMSSTWWSMSEPTIRSKRCPRGASSSPWTAVTFVMPASSIRCRATFVMPAEASSNVTDCTTGARLRPMAPVPAPTSSTVVWGVSETWARSAATIAAARCVCVGSSSQVAARSSKWLIVRS